MKRLLNKLLKQNRIYRHEQIFIATLLVCFVIVGSGLPFISDYVQISDPNQSSKAEAVINENNLILDNEKNSNSKQDNDKNATVDNKKASSTETSSDLKSKSSSSKNNTSNKKSSASASSSGGSSNSSNKTWVPPVYKTVHHDAVYETQKVVVCNYCGATFSSTSAFQVHKDEHGG